MLFTGVGEIAGFLIDLLSKSSYTRIVGRCTHIPENVNHILTSKR